MSKVGRSSLKILFVSLILFSCKKEYLATVQTSEILEIESTSAKSGGIILNEGSSPIIQRGVCWSIETEPTIDDFKTNDGDGLGSFVSQINNLITGTTYYLRAYATNKSGTGYGLTMSFTTPLKDVENNLYTLVTIGNQIWMGENLKTTRYNDGMEIPKINDNSEWMNLNSPGFNWYNNDSLNKAQYGGLYNWHAVNTNKLCPIGWHVASYSDWVKLENTLGGKNNAQNKLKTVGTLYWLTPNTGATNESGFSAMPGGDRFDTGNFMFIGKFGYWWTSTQFPTFQPYAYHYFLTYNNESSGINWCYKTYGFSVRCIKDI